MLIIVINLRESNLQPFLTYLHRHVKCAYRYRFKTIIAGLMAISRDVKCYLLQTQEYLNTFQSMEADVTIYLYKFGYTKGPIK